MSKNVTLFEYPEGTVLKSYDTIVAFKSTSGRADVTYASVIDEKFYSKTTTRQINEFFGGADKAAKIKKLPQTYVVSIAKFLEAYHNG